MGRQAIEGDRTRSPITWVTALAALGLVWMVPQLHHPLFHLPVYAAGTDVHYLWLWTAFTWLLVMAYALGARWVVHPEQEASFAGWWCVWILCAAVVVGLLRCCPVTAPRVQDVTGWLPAPPDLLLLLATLIALPSPFHPRHSNTIARALRRVLPYLGLILMVAAAVWLGSLGRWPQAIVLAVLTALGASLHSHWRFVPPVLQLLRLPLFWFAVYFAVGELVWILPASIPESVSHEAYTVWAIYHGVFTLIACARVIDACSARWGATRVRIVAGVVLAGLAILGLRPVTVGRIDPTRATERVQEQWFAALEARLAAIEKLDEEDSKKYPVVALAVSGGGSRAAMFAALILEALEPLPGRAAPKVAGMLGRFRDRILMVSAVSGGSLATAYWLGQRGDSSGRAVGRWVNGIPSEITRWMPEADRELTWTHRVPPVAAIPDWVGTNRFIDDMGRSFMAPILRGMFMPGYERGQSVTDYWQEEFGWAGLEDKLQKRATGTLPLVMFNATDIDRGQRLILGFPSVPGAVLAGTSARSLGDVDPQCLVTVAEAVRLSANFPWGFCSPRLAVSDEDKTPPSITDGGVVDNTGIDSILAVFQGLHHLATRERQAGAPEGRASGVLQRLRRRGVLLLVIDSGAQPSAHRSLLVRAFPEALEPLRGMSNAGNASGSWRKGLAADLLSFYLGGGSCERSAGADLFDFTCQRDDAQVITAWALGPRDKATLLCQFHMVMSKLESEIEEVEGELSLFRERRDTVEDAKRVEIDEFRALGRMQRALEQDVGAAPKSSTATQPEQSPAGARQEPPPRARVDALHRVRRSKDAAASRIGVPRK